MRLSALHKRILNEFQHGLPVCHAPWAEMARILRVSEQDVLDAVAELQAAGVMSRAGAVFNHCRAGCSTLAAVSVPEDKVEEIANKINSLKSVNHNYQREHDYNLWFVVTAPDIHQLQQVLDTVEQWVDSPVLNLPMQRAYHIDLGFRLNWAHNGTEYAATNGVAPGSRARFTA